MYEKILLAADGSGESHAAARAVNGFIAGGFAKQVIILNVASTFAGSTFEKTTARSDKMNQMAKEFGLQVIQEIREMLTGEVEIIEKVELGDPAYTICDEANANGCNLIVMGSRGNNPLRGLFLGSVSARVLQFAECPVLVVKS